MRGGTWRLGGATRAAIGAAAIVVVATGLGACSAGSATTASAGHPVPDIAATAIGGPAVSLHGLRGRWVVVNFFATWCDPCKTEYPQLVRFAKDHQAAAQVVGVVYEDRNADALRFHRAEGGTWPIIADPSGRIANRYRVSALPQSFVVDPKGVLVAHLFGGVTVANLDQAMAGSA